MDTKPSASFYPSVSLQWWTGVLLLGKMSVSGHAYRTCVSLVCCFAGRRGFNTSSFGPSSLCFANPTGVFLFGSGHNFVWRVTALWRVGSSRISTIQLSCSEIEASVKVAIASGVAFVVFGSTCAATSYNAIGFQVGASDRGRNEFSLCHLWITNWTKQLSNVVSQIAADDFLVGKTSRGATTVEKINLISCLNPRASLPFGVSIFTALGRIRRSFSKKVRCDSYSLVISRSSKYWFCDFHGSGTCSFFLCPTLSSSNSCKTFIFSQKVVITRLFQTTPRSLLTSPLPSTLAWVWKSLLHCSPFRVPVRWIEAWFELCCGLRRLPGRRK